MFIELTEILRCPREHQDTYVICVPITMDGRRVVRGVVSCPICQADYPVIDGVVYFSSPDEPVAVSDHHATALTPDAACTFLGLDGPGGYVLLVGHAGRLAAGLADVLPGTQFIAINPPAGVASGATLSVLRSARTVPLKRPSVRGAVVGPDAAVEPWLTETAAALLPGLRLVAELEGAVVPGMAELARGAGVYVGEKQRG